MEIRKSGWMVAGITAVFGWAMIASYVSARPVHVLTLEETYRDASLIVIATPLETRDYAEFRLDGTPDQAVDVLTDFAVEAVVQGSLPLAEDNGKRMVTVLHRRYVDLSAEVLVVDGPSFVEFDPSFQNRYLIILKREHGMYVPLTGQYDSPESFFLLKPYFRGDERKPVPPPG